MKVVCGRTEAKVKLTKLPKHKGMVAIRYPDFDSALRAANVLVSSNPGAIETIDDTIVGLAQNDVIWHSVAHLLAQAPGEPPLKAVNLVEFESEELSVVDQKLRELELVRPDLYFIGACGVDVQAGVTAVDYEEAEFKRRLAAQSKATAVVATASKIGAVASYSVLPISQLTHLIVEAATSAEVVEAYAAAGTRLLRAGA